MIGIKKYMVAWMTQTSYTAISICNQCVRKEGKCLLQKRQDQSQRFNHQSLILMPMESCGVEQDNSFLGKTASQPACQKR
ncbi:MAG: hypothetical protein A2900_02870 [Candidatus Chisholmbacteria bacterium RIFCSPLOWO2_01_FULL_50_28]|uniref:Uncharacterized protein n=1 Tax=Candidatus Chisholmbacteria bacterium RIFCSPHIGHO2_01_FULL_52_32 TaxID=1797591 RepID=A0A1G1VT90_9BACT|nr:MAG: hypothetical protein A2786_03875 [Candidatus Chisholmbacteria bacterium RIFCSPHIGHO2_01_FULL_52_32]OGY20020.1 MAG: hypothetical protein A2900_02870 [Candidatus Chisholmbacteria bacterium RIFCSPLOWO2_01_FULL_50_28]